ncbi:MAG: CoA transferase [Myxococcota bacterium]|nr:CoA transferase [Myxococcota bacterium]
MERPLQGPLSGIRVIETAALLPGPWCCAILAELGADVIKVEPPEGDPARRFPPFLPGGESALFVALNRGKRGAAIDLKTPGGRDAFLDLVRAADVVVSSWRPGVAERLGLGRDAIDAANPRVVTCSITGWGETGPHRLRPGHDVNYQAWAGTASLAGSPGSGPATPGVLAADLAGGTLPAAVAILAALIERSSTGRGRHVDVAMAVGTVPLLQMTHALISGGLPPPGPGDGPFTSAFPCYRIYATREGHLAVGALEPKFWRVFCEVVGLPDLEGDALAQGERRDEAVRRIETRLAEATAEEWEARFDGKETCVERVRGLGEVFRDPWLAGIGAVFEGDHPTAGRVTHLRALPAWPERVALRPAPTLGQHTAEVLAEATAAGDGRGR